MLKGENVLVLFDVNQEGGQAIYSDKRCFSDNADLSR